MRWVSRSETIAQLWWGTGNCSYNFYLYDPKTNRFVPSGFLSGLGTPGFDQAKKQVTTNWNSSAYDTSNETYQHENGDRYTLIKKQVSTRNRNRRTVTVSTHELRNGQMELAGSKPHLNESSAIFTDAMTSLLSAG